MLKNYIVINFRNLRKHFSYSLINILGLGLGLATCLLLVIWIKHELSYDKFHKKADRIYRASLEYGYGGQTARVSVSPTALLPAIKSLPEIEEGVRVYNPASWSPFIVKRADYLFLEDHFYFADSTFFKVFSYNLIKGNKAKALTEPYSVILTRSGAQKYFGDQDPIGKTLIVNDTQEYTVTGVVEDVPENSFLQFDFLASFSSLRQAREEPIWWSANYQTFVVIHEQADINVVVSKTNEIVKQALASQLSNPGDYVKYNFMKLTDIHLRSDYSNEPEPVGNIQYVYIFSAIAVLILLIACINYINLATARAIDRAKEVGIRKVVGAVRKQLFGQFMGESIMITFFAFCFAFFIAQLSLPIFNYVTGSNLNGSIFYTSSVLGLGFLILMLIALLSGVYPAMVITSFKPVSILKGNFKFSRDGIWLRKALVIVQFCITIILIVGTLVILKQLDFLQNKRLGYDKENTIILPLDEKTEKVYSQLKTELLRTGIVKHIGRATESPTQIKGGYGFNVEGQREDQGSIITAVAADTGFIPSLGIELIAGRNFTDADFQQVKSDTLYSFIVNEAALKTFFIEKENAVGMKANVSGRKGKIVGVMNDFHFSSLHNPIGPLVMFSQEDYNHIFIKLNSGDIQSSIQTLKSAYSNVIHHKPFEYEFLDEQYSALYTSEQRMGTIFTIFAALAIIIACLGLLGLVAFAAAQKTKEIGIRKVLGATASNIVILITRDFTRLVILAIVMGLPLAYWIMTQWLDDFAYKTSIGVGPILLASAVCIVLALGTSGYQAIKAAFIDPVKTLRNE